MGLGLHSCSFDTSQTQFLAHSGRAQCLKPLAFTQSYSIRPMLSPILQGACKVFHATFLLYKSRLKTFQKASVTFALMPILSAQ